MIVPTGDFDWHSDKESVVLSEQLAIAVYPNQHGAIVIRQERAWDEDADIIIIIQPRNARAVADALVRAAAFVAGQECPNEEVLVAGGDGGSGTVHEGSENADAHEPDTLNEVPPLFRKAG